MKVWVVTWSEFDWDYGKPVRAFTDEAAADAFAREYREGKHAEFPHCGCDVYALDVQ